MLQRSMAFHRLARVAHPDTPDTRHPLPAGPGLFRTFLHTLRADAEHYTYANGKRWYTHLGFWVGATYRFGHLAGEVPFAPLKFLMLVAYVLVSMPIRVVMHVNIPRQVEIGPGFCMHHPQNIIFPGEAILGRNVTIYQEVTIGRGPNPGVPRIGDRVSLYAGSKVLGGVTIGDDCEIGANVVITRNIPARSVVAPPPARAIPKVLIERMRRGRLAREEAPSSEA